jgi:hypothetical protein
MSEQLLLKTSFNIQDIILLVFLSFSLHMFIDFHKLNNEIKSHRDFIHIYLLRFNHYLNFISSLNFMLETCLHPTKHLHSYLSN